ncbi:hypothetical protein Purlil1_12969 [Purpureocillium lilacinum]|uniref:F-box domain-containing protein n=1 Tax=Purpureocillium lilacinum TaxID=33203 RepID=A0ABR0BFF6_PURLI|nr:hypothetical protein Purlil1_12969 [Purpureocillium lilacinum]
MGRLQTLPPEILGLIFVLLQEADISSLRGTSRTVRNVSERRYKELGRSVSIMLSSESLERLEMISNHHKHRDCVRSLVVRTAHVPTYVRSDGASCLFPGNEYQISLNQQQQFLDSGDASTRLGKALNKLTNCNKICLTDANDQKPLGFDRLRRRISPIEPQLGINEINPVKIKNTTYTMDCGESETFLNQALATMIKAAAQCSSIASIDIAIGKADPPGPISSNGLVFSEDEREHFSQAFSGVTYLRVMLLPECSKAKDLRRFLRLFSGLEVLEVEFLEAHPDDDLIRALLYTKVSALKSLKLAGCDLGRKMLLKVLIHYQKAKEITLREFWLPEDQDWDWVRENLIRAPEGPAVILDKCGYGETPEEGTRAVL